MKFTKSQKMLSGILIVVVLIITGIGVLYIQNQEQLKYTGPVEKITVAAANYLTGVLVYIAEDQGFFEKNGLNVTIKDYTSGKAAGDAVLNGEADISTSAGFVFVSHSFNYTDLRILGTVATKQVKELIARKDKGITTINDLIGKKIGVTKKSGAEFLFGTFLTYNALSYQDVEIVDLRPQDIVESISNGSIDAAFIWDPYLYEIKEILGENAISWPGGEDFYFVLLTKEDWLTNNSAATKRFMKSLIEAEDYVKDNSEEIKEFAEDKFGDESAYLEYSWPKQKFVVTLQQAMLVTFEDQARWRIENNLTDETVIPNYLNYIYIDALEEVKPEAVTIIRGEDD